jgi:orotidine-5'-phosphate decarboxylase
MILARDRLIVALDAPNVEEALRLVDTLGESVTFYKIGYRLAFVGGLGLAEMLMKRGKHVFLDLKLHDIGNTVKQGVASIASLGATFLTVHAYPQTMRAAVEGKGSSKLKILAVTALTSYDDHDAQEAGYRLAVRDLVRLKTEQARTIGIDGVVCSAAETHIVREAAGLHMAIVTPGIRPEGSVAGDQKRTLTPREAILSGVDYLVVGRPILNAPDPAHAAEGIVADIDEALKIKMRG